MTNGKGLFARTERAFVSFNLGSFCLRWYMDFVKVFWKKTREDMI